MELTIPKPTKRVASVLATIKKTPEMSDGIAAMMQRADEFAHPMTAMLAGIAVNPAARRHLDTCLDLMWASDAARLPKASVTQEVVIGGGLHAAIYCAVRVAQGYEKPLVLEAAERAGGAFAVSRESAFYLNSRNRPGGLGFPGRDGALNVLPGAVIQPSDLSGDEYQRNTDLAYAVRATLAMNARVLTGTRVSDVDGAKDDARGCAYRVLISDADAPASQRKIVYTNRIVIATGLGRPSRLGQFESNYGERLLTFNQFMHRMDEPFPMRGVKRVAVVGSGDSGKTIIEALLGQGPTTRWSVASLDYIDSIDWYGVPSACVTKEGWTASARSRYKGIARELPGAPSGGNRPYRLNPLAERAGAVAPGYQSAFVNDRPYDLVIDCTGFDGTYLTTPWAAATDANVSGRSVGRQLQRDVFVIGPAAKLPVGSTEAEFNGVVTAVPENSTALFRYAERTASLAAALPIPAGPQPTARGRRGKRNELRPGAYTRLNIAEAAQVAVNAATLRIDANAPTATNNGVRGDATGLKDREGMAIRIGDPIRFTDSGRFGTGTGIVTGNTGGRVGIRIEQATTGDVKSDEAREYSASTGRVEVMPF